ncbi:MAG: hypothetical protein NUV91_03290 [Candidatus Omnitrophica bacterium]|nr:hypothetical protein [Candidatus Omnitrophota bacterium]
MRNTLMVSLLLGSFLITGCETVKKGTTTAGKAVGQGADAVGGITEGAAEGYKSKDATADNPYGR